MKKSLFATTVLFAIIFLPLHILPPILSNPEFRAQLGQTGGMLVSLAHHLGFTIAGITLLLLPPVWRSAIAGRPKSLAILSVLPPLVVLPGPLPFQLLGRFVGGMLAAALLTGFYRRMKENNDYQNLPAIFAMSALLLETCALITGWLVSAAGSSAGMQFGLGVTLVLALLITTEPGRATLPRQAASSNGRFSFSGSHAFMTIAIMAYGGFFLLLLLLGSLQAFEHASLISGVAIFSTAMAFSLGNMLPLHKLEFFQHRANPVRVGCAISAAGSALVWLGYANTSSLLLLPGVVLVALGNGITISRCFQNAALTSTDGFSAPLLTMIGVMLLPVVLTLGASMIKTSAPEVLLLAFSVACLIAFGIRNTRAVTA